MMQHQECWTLFCKEGEGGRVFISWRAEGESPWKREGGLGRKNGMKGGKGDRIGEERASRWT